MLPSEANGHPAFGRHPSDYVAGAFHAHSLDVAFAVGTRVSGIALFLHPELLTRFVPPERLAPSDRQPTATTANAKVATHA
jgi:hypothetical protein